MSVGISLPSADDPQSPFGLDPAALYGDCAPSTAEAGDATLNTCGQLGTQSHVPVQVRIGVWTQNQIPDLAGWVQGHDWPEELGPLDVDNVEELVHIPLRTDPRGGYRTIISMMLFTDQTAEDAVTTLEQLDFVDYAKLECESVVQFGAGDQEAFDALTRTAQDGGEDFTIFAAGTGTVSAGPVQVRIGVWTEEQITDLPAWVESHDWPEGLGPLDVDNVEELVHIPLRTDPRGGYRTIISMILFTDMAEEDAVATLGQLDFVEYARLRSQSVGRYGSHSQELIDALTYGGSKEPVHLCVAPVVSQSTLIEMRLTFWTPEMIPDLRAFVEAHDWPDGLGPVDAECVEELVHIPVRSEPRGGYFTIVCMHTFTQLSAQETATALQELEFVEHARPESECVIDFGPRAQECIDATSTGAWEGQGHLCGGANVVESAPVQARIAVWTEERITDLSGWVQTQEWPAALGPICPEGQVEQLASMPLWQDSRGGYRTVLKVEVYGAQTAGGFEPISEQEAVAEFEQLDFVDYAKPESECSFKYSARTQELLDAITVGHAPGGAHSFVDEVQAPGSAVDVRVEFWTQQKVPDAGAFVKQQDWRELSSSDLAQFLIYIDGLNDMGDDVDAWSQNGGDDTAIVDPIYFDLCLNGPWQ